MKEAKGFTASVGLSGGAVPWPTCPKIEAGLEAASVVDEADGWLRNENGLVAAGA